MTGAGGRYALPQAQLPWPARDALRVTRVRAVVTSPEGIPLVVVHVDTSEDGLYGLGCATFTQRYAAVVAAVEEHIAPLVVSRHPADIEDITRLVHYSSYWRGGPVLGNALSGVDQALWDIAGKRAGMPVYELLGGRSRSAVEVYGHAGGADAGETLERAEALIDAGYRHVRLQVGGPGLGTYGAPGTPGGYPRSPHPDGWSVDQYRAASPVPLAVGEQIGNVADAVRLIRDGGVDLLRLHTSAVGGLTPTRKLVALAELTGVRTAFHSPADITPVGVAANLAVDVSTPAFGYQESHEYNDATHEVFPGIPVVRDGYLYPSEQPGWGVDLDERAARRHPPEKFLHERWAARVRRPDGGLEAP